MVIVSYSGGYLPTAYALAHGGAVHRVKGVILMDSIYGDHDKFAGWAAQRIDEAEKCGNRLRDGGKEPAHA